MTIDELNMLTDNELRAHVATAEGWTQLSYASATGYEPRGWPPPSDAMSAALQPIPNYISLDVAWGLIRRDKDGYALEVFASCIPDKPPLTARETARCLCIAYLMFKQDER